MLCVRKWGTRNTSTAWIAISKFSRKRKKWSGVLFTHFRWNLPFVAKLSIGKQHQFYSELRCASWIMKGNGRQIAEMGKPRWSLKRHHASWNCLPIGCTVPLYFLLFHKPIFLLCKVHASVQVSFKRSYSRPTTIQPTPLVSRSSESSILKLACCLSQAFQMAQKEGRIPAAWLPQIQSNGWLLSQVRFLQSQWKADPLSLPAGNYSGLSQIVTQQALHNTFFVKSDGADFCCSL